MSEKKEPNVSIDLPDKDEDNEHLIKGDRDKIFNYHTHLRGSGPLSVDARAERADLLTDQELIEIYQEKADKLFGSGMCFLNLEDGTLKHAEYSVKTESKLLVDELMWKLDDLRADRKEMSNRDDSRGIK